MLRRHEASDRVTRLAGFAFNPLVLYEAAVGGHNDWVMVAPAAWAFAVIDDTPLIAGLLIGAAIAVKYMAAVALPFLAARAWRKSPPAAILLTVLSFIVPWLCARPFALGQSAAQTLATVGSQLSMSLNWLLTFPFFRTGTADRPAIAGLPGLPYLGVLTWPRIIQVALVAALGVVVTAAVIRYIMTARRSNLYRAIAGLLWALPAMHPWYLTWLSPALVERGAWGIYTSWYLGFGLLVYAHEGLVLTPWHLAIFVGITLTMLAVPLAASRAAPAQSAIKSA
jgi:hypothetical protein